jgi:hypothetical protein
MRSSTLRWGWLLAGLLLLGSACDSEEKETGDKEEEEKEKKKKEKKKKKKEDLEANLKKAKEQCDSLGNACGKKDEYKKKIAEGCKEPLEEQVKKGCTDQVVKALTCYEKEICPGKEEVQVYDDFRVLTARHKKCQDEIKAAHSCLTEE